MTEMLTEAMAPVLADIRRTGAPSPRLGEPSVDGDGDLITVMLWAPDGSGAGVHVVLTESPVDQVVRATDLTQEWVIEAARGGPNDAWPPCPRHPGTHPLAPSVVEGRASWVCPRDEVAVCAIGEFAPTTGGGTQ